MNPDQLFHSAVNAHRNGRLPEAETLYRQLLSLKPSHADALHLLGVLCHQTRRHQEATSFIERALALIPNNADFHNNLGLALQACGQLDQAVSHFNQGLAISPRDTDLLANLASAYHVAGQLPEAIASYRKILHLNPRDQDAIAALPHALQALGIQQQQRGAYAAAEKTYAEAVTLQPQDAALHYNLGNAQRELGKAAEAAASYHRSIELSPHDADSHNNLGNVLRELGQLEQAMVCYQRALALDPLLYHAKVHLVHQKQHACDWQNIEEDIAQIREWVATAPQVQISPFAFLAMPGTTAAEQQQCAENWTRQRYAKLMQEPALLGPTAARKVDTGTQLRIGYLSADFRLHPLASLITEMLELHDRDKVEVYAYSYAVDDHTPARQRIEQAVDHFIDIRPLSIHEAAQQIHADHIDILVDLTGYTQGSRTGILALRPAPIQVSWLGFPGTMGAPFIDYILSDAFITPAAQASYYTEQLALLPTTYQPNDRQRPIANTPSRNTCGLPEDAFVFCCFNQSFKIVPQVFASWMRILQATPQSILWLLECNASARKNLQQAAQEQGIDPARLIFAPRVPMDQHLARHALADLFLDTAPYNAHTTASDALWMGLPLITCSGDTFASRVAGSLLQVAGLHELITFDPAHYETLAISIAQDQALLNRYRERLQATRDSKLFDTARFTQALEALYLRLQKAPAHQLT
ncbi:tetratricopeptide repeat protein [Methylobacillus gramineus]|uniref:tetratricopeptide repeat protein n=1 Tax=Methylobacillus gramineus TaxID=755169 RepID=UPI001CFFED57|nr:glycosyltransferase family 41 protein [Methylobacillus gramineus]MCB5184274.1 tetratricopeptide repeat protein [Methylobacillus gramineus]